MPRSHHFSRPPWAASIPGWPGRPPESPAPPGTYHRVTADTFATGFVDAMRTALVACAGVLVAAALCCFLFSPHKKPTARPTAGQRAETTPHD
ncbi:hypothetical protein [Streptomyces sp. 5-6(2022)]|uniref:hypothetical protein n=1 Tax=Streptomyces sp. 5-6(2022) TaxID=2936510 RepID=UPI0023B8AEFD|nr:hypothetical protein [Streptomyces sp. 5-6(2022)]